MRFTAAVQPPHFMFLTVSNSTGALDTVEGFSTWDSAGADCVDKAAHVNKETA